MRNLIFWMPRPIVFPFHWEVLPRGLMEDKKHSTFESEPVQSTTIAVPGPVRSVSHSESEPAGARWAEPPEPGVCGPRACPAGYAGKRALFRARQSLASSHHGMVLFAFS